MNAFLVCLLVFPCTYAAPWIQVSGDEVATALEGFAEQSADERLARARVLETTGGAAEIGRAIDLCTDPDPRVRRVLLDFLARPDLSSPESLGDARRIESFERAALDDPDPAVRFAALEALRGLDSDAAVQALGRLVEELPAPERALAAASLPATPRSAALVRALVLGGFADRPPHLRTPDDVLAAVLPLHGRLLADAPAGGESADERAPLVLGLRHPARVVRNAARRAFEQLLGRLRELGEAPRALRVLAGLEQQGVDPRLIGDHGARLALYPGADPAAARLSARSVRRVLPAPTAGAADEFELRAWLFRSYYLEAVAELALGDPQAARPLFSAAQEVLDALLGQRTDREGEEPALRHAEALHHRALLELAGLIRSLLEGASPTDRELLARARRAHLFALEAQLAGALQTENAISTWDMLLDHDLSPLRLLFTGLELPGLSIDRGLAVQGDLGRVLASVAPYEMPGFTPAPDLPPEVFDPLQDPRRLDLLIAIQEARVDSVLKQRDELMDEVQRDTQALPGILPAAKIAEIDSLDRRRRQLLMVLANGPTGRDGGWHDLLELRVPSNFALWLARDLRAEGRAADSRRLAETMRTQLESSGIFRRYYWGFERLAQIEMAIGTSYTDEGEPEQAEDALLKAVERLEGIEKRMREAGARERDLLPVQAIRCNALVSLAVNSNVKLGDPEKALEYYERAYELRQDDFMRVLLACYRARSGRKAEAQALLRETRPSPQTYYNIACTYALLGESARALEYLELELTENLGSEAARQRQREWARDDPDLASLREDPRFRALIRVE